MPVISRLRGKVGVVCWERDLHHLCWVLANAQRQGVQVPLEASSSIPAYFGLHLALRGGAGLERERELLYAALCSCLWEARRYCEDDVEVEQLQKLQSFFSDAVSRNASSFRVSEWLDQFRHCSCTFESSRHALSWPCLRIGSFSWNPPKRF